MYLLGGHIINGDAARGPLLDVQGVLGRDRCDRRQRSVVSDRQRHVVKTRPSK